MLYHLHHQTIYTYNQSVYVKPHLIRLRPRCNGWQQLRNFTLTLKPDPKHLAQIQDLDGNSVISAWFAHPTQQLIIDIMAEVETHLDNPFTFLLEPWALHLPFDYPQSLLSQLQPYLQPYRGFLNPIALELAQDLLHEVNGETLTFLSTLNQRIYETCDYLTRETGDPMEAGITWKKKAGSCRDFSVLFMDVCRAIGLPARFVSGYQEGDADTEQFDLHAWVEVYLPGGGWRGYDPTHGLAVGDRHIALVASANPAYAAPVTGTVTPVKAVLETGQPVESKMEAHISIVGS